MPSQAMLYMHALVNVQSCFSYMHSCNAVVESLVRVGLPHGSHAGLVHWCAASPPMKMYRRVLLICITSLGDQQLRMSNALDEIGPRAVDLNN